MDGIQLDIYKWLTELEDYEAANLLKACTIDLKYVDVAFGLHDDTEVIINDVDIHIPLKKYKNIGQNSILINSIEEALRELGQSRGEYARNINWLPIVPVNIAVKGYDAFISHASEDKDAFVRPLAKALTARGFRVWYDEFTLKVGDSLRQTIDNGLKNSNFGVIVLSQAFFEKNWPQYELNGLTAREIDGHKVILPIWHNVSKANVLGYSPTLADKVALHSPTLSIEAIADKLEEVLNDSTTELTDNAPYQSIKELTTANKAKALIADQLKSQEQAQFLNIQGYDASLREYQLFIDSMIVSIDTIKQEHPNWLIRVHEEHDSFGKILRIISKARQMTIQLKEPHDTLPQLHISIYKGIWAFLPGQLQLKQPQLLSDWLFDFSLNNEKMFGWISVTKKEFMLTSKVIDEVLIKFINYTIQSQNEGGYLA